MYVGNYTLKNMSMYIFTNKMSKVFVFIVVVAVRED